MPYGDRTGPMGVGPRSGRGFGYCSGSGRPGYMAGSRRRGGYGAAGYGESFGRGQGFGAARTGRRHRFFARAGFAAEPYGEPTKEEELAGLREEASWLNDRIEAVNKRIEELGE